MSITPCLKTQVGGTVVAIDAQTSMGSGSGHPRNRSIITDGQLWPLQPNQLRFTNHVSPPGTAPSTEAFIIIITLMVLEAHVKLLLLRALPGEKIETLCVLTADAPGSNGL